MKTTWSLILVAFFLCCSPAHAEYCSTSSEGKSISCIFKVDRIPKNSQLILSYTAQGWSMMIVVFIDEFQMIEGDATVKPGKGTEIQSIEYITTRRDMTPEGLMMEAAVYNVSEDLLHQLGKAKGKVRFWLVGNTKKDKEVEISAGQFSDIEAYITETKTELSVLFENK